MWLAQAARQAAETVAAAGLEEHLVGPAALVAFVFGGRPAPQRLEYCQSSNKSYCDSSRHMQQLTPSALLCNLHASLFRRLKPGKALTNS